MTVSLKVHVNGFYQATVKHSVDDQELAETKVGPGEEKVINFHHGKTNTLVVTEHWIGDPADKPEEE